MISLETLIAVVVSASIIAYLPGPALIYTTAQTLSGGKQVGLLAVLGLHVGGYFHILSAAAGLTALLHSVPTAYLVIKVLGACYLIWLGIGLIRQGFKVEDLDVVIEKKNKMRAFYDGVVVEIFNPKAAIFFLAFLPQFVDPSAGMSVWLQFIILGAIVNVTFNSADLLCVFIASRVTAYAKNSGSFIKRSKQVGGLLLIALGVRLVIQKST